MDPISKAVAAFQEDFRTFRDDSKARVLRIVAGPEHVRMLTQVLRAEEWHLANRSPFLVFDTAYVNETETFETMTRVVREHYAVLKEALVEQDTTLPDFQLPAGTSPEPVDFLVSHVQAFTKGIEAVLDAPLVCWMPTNVEDPENWGQAVVRLFGPLWDQGYCFVVAGEENAYLAESFGKMGDQVAEVRFEIDEEETQNYFQKLMAQPSAGRAPGTMPGAAAPDVAPPPRPGPPQPTDEEIRAVAEEMGLPPMLTPAQAEQLRLFVFEAAQGAGNKDEQLTLEKQKAACDLCAQAEVKLEHAMMTMLLANYLLQFGREAEAEAEFRQADELAGEAGALPQVAQARMALAYLLLKNNRLAEAADRYEQAAAAAAIGESNLLYIECLRMAGTCHLQAGRPHEAMLCWQAAVERGRDASTDEVRLSNFLDVSARLIELLRRNALHDQARSVEQLVSDLGEKMAA